MLISKFPQFSSHVNPPGTAYRHARCSKGVDESEPGLVGMGIPPMSISLALYGINQSDALVIAERVCRPGPFNKLEFVMFCGGLMPLF